MKSLYINTATQQTTVALYDGAEIVAEKRWPSQQDEADKLQPAIDELVRSQNLTPDNIQRLVVCVGPGGFTSVRIGVSAVNTWSFAKQIPVAAVSIFDLYPSPEAIAVVSANSNEAWLKLPGHDPQWIHQEHLKLPANFSYTGIVNDAWKKILNDLGGSFADFPEALPKIDALVFEQQIVRPWYYKDPNITWSDKHHAVHRLNTDR